MLDSRLRGNDGLRRGDYFFTASEVVARYADSRLWRSDQDGAVRIDLASGLALSSYRSEYHRYWQGR